MLNPIKLGLVIVAAALVVSILMGLIVPLIGFGLKLAVIAGIVIVVYGLVSGAKALGGGRSRLP
jgi:hypothetical protein